MLRRPRPWCSGPRCHVARASRCPTELGEHPGRPAGGRRRPARRPSRTRPTAVRPRSRARRPPAAAARRRSPARARRPGPSSPPPARRARPARPATAERVARMVEHRHHVGELVVATASRPRAHPAPAPAASRRTTARRSPRRGGPAGQGRQRASTTASRRPVATDASRVSTLPRTLDDVEVGPRGQQLGAPAWRPGADDRAGGQGRQREPVAGDEHVARVGALRYGGEDDSRRRVDRQVLERVHRDVDATGQQRVAQRRHEHPGAAELRSAAPSTCRRPWSPRPARPRARWPS